MRRSTEKTGQTANRHPARLHVLLAREARIALVIRRGPSKSVAVIGWDRRKDTFQVGQWLRGRIYERRCDLSPTGKWFIYFAMNGRWDSKTKGSWTAISRTPYLKAVSLLAKGDCWNGGGLFTGEDQYWLNGFGHVALREETLLVQDPAYRPVENFGGECPGVYYLRLQRDGWNMVERKSHSEWNDTTTFEKPLSGGWVLRKLAHEQVGAPPGKGCYWDEHELVHFESGATVDGKDWEWADLDGKRLVWAQHGQLWAGYVRKGGLHDSRCLHNFNDMTFEAIAAPY